MDQPPNDSLIPFVARQPALQWLKIPQIVDEVCGSLAPRLAAQRIESVIDIPRHLVVMADREMLLAAVKNMVCNALDAMPMGGRLVVTCCIGQGGLELEVADSGPGLSDEVRRRAFEPNFTTKSGAAGLGLSVVKRIAQAHGGTVTATNCPEGGAAFTLRLPARATKAAA